MMDETKQRFKVSGRVVIRKIGGDTLLVPVSGTAAGGRVYPVNETAEVVWACLADGGTVRQAAEALVARYDVPQDQALADCGECVQVFVDEALIEGMA